MRKIIVVMVAAALLVAIFNGLFRNSCTSLQMITAGEETAPAESTFFAFIASHSTLTITQKCNYWNAEQISLFVSTDGEILDLELPNYSLIEQSEARHTIVRDVFDGADAIVVAEPGDSVSYSRVTEGGWRYDVFINNARKLVLITGAKI